MHKYLPKKINEFKWQMILNRNLNLNEKKKIFNNLLMIFFLSLHGIKRCKQYGLSNASDDVNALFDFD